MEINLSYKKFKIITPKNFHSLWNDDYLADVTLATVNNKHVRAHKIILSSSSVLFKNIFRRNHPKNSLIYLKDIHYEYLDLIMEFIYT